MRALESRAITQNSPAHIGFFGLRVAQKHDKIFNLWPIPSDVVYYEVS